MKLFLVTGQNYGTMRRAVVGGQQRLASTNKAEALRRFKTEKHRLEQSGCSFDLALFQVTTPNHVGAELWIQFLETGDISEIEFKAIDRASFRKSARDT